MSIKKSLIIIISPLLAIFVVSTVWNFLLSWELNKGTPVAPKGEIKDNADENKNYFYYMYEEWGYGVDYYGGNEINYTTVKEVAIDKDQCLAMMNERDIDPKTVFVANYSYQSIDNDLVTLEAKTSLSIPDYWEDDRLVEFESGYGIQLKTPTTPRDLEFIVKARGCHDEAQIEIYNVDTGVTLGTVDVTEEKYSSKAD